MPQVVTCPAGHAWEVPTSDLHPDVVETVCCPACRSLAGDRIPPPLRLPAWPGPAVPGYELQGELGRGSMGVVYRARDLGHDRPVALKMIRPPAPFDPALWSNLLGYFRVEGEAVRRLRHRNVVRVYEVGEAAGRPFLALEFVEGVTLERHWAGLPQHPATAAALVEAVARGVHAAHESRIIHRDLKPLNVLLAADGIPKVADFGLAKILDAGTGYAPGGGSGSQVRAVMGTPCYMAPEQATAGRVGPWTDVYALGAILYQGLTGRPPFLGPTPTAILEQVTAHDPVPPSRSGEGCPGQLEVVCLKCLAKERRQRYTTAAEVADALRAFCKDAVRPCLAGCA
jgi:serine/threonine protein kinase